MPKIFQAKAKIVFGQWAIILFLSLQMLPRQVYGQFSYKNIDVLYDSAWTYENLQLIPIKFKGGQDRNGEGGIISLSDAIRQNKVSIRELSKKIVPEKGTVTITNKTKSTILVHSGELIDGGKQDRVFANTTLIPPGSKKIQLNTFCIEKGRWDDKAQPFVYKGSGDTDLRKIIDTKHSQAGVWKEIDNRYDSLMLHSDTWSYLNLEKDSSEAPSKYFEYFEKKFMEGGGGYAGFLFITGNTIISVELFANSDITNASFKPMVLSYINSMLQKSNPPIVSQEKQKEFLDNILMSPDSQHKMIRQQGRAYMFERKMIHMVVYGSKP